MTASVLGGVAMPHAPQFFTLSETEDKAMVERIRSLAEDNGAKLARLEPDAWIVVANDHVNQFFLHCTPPFTFHVGGEGVDVARPLSLRSAEPVLSVPEKGAEAEVAADPRTGARAGAI